MHVWTLLLRGALPVASACSPRARRVVAFRGDARPPPIPAGSRPVWVHAASVGEVGAARGLIDVLPGVPVLLTCGTPEGLERARRDGVGDVQAPLPLDLPGPLAAFVGGVQPRALVLVESEIWPNMLGACREAGVPVAVAGARMSARSAWRWSLVRPLARSILGGIRLFAAASGVDAARLIRAGVAPERVAVAGRLKRPEPPPEGDPRRSRIRALLRGRPALVAGSVHPGEEAVVRAAAAALRERDPRAIAVIAPRHPGGGYGTGGAIPLSRAGEGALPDGADLEFDALGWLDAAYAEGAVGLVGGGFAGKASHDLMEAAASGLRLVHGPRVEGQEDIAEALAAQGVAFPATGPAAAAAAVGAILDAGPAPAWAARAVLDGFDGRLRTVEALRGAGVLD